MKKIKNIIFIIASLGFNYAFTQEINSNTPILKGEPIKVSKDEVKEYNQDNIHIFKQRVSSNYSKLGYSFPDSLVDGTWLCYFDEDSSRLAFVLNYKNSIRSGVMIAYYLDGTLRFSKTYKEGKLNGKSISFELDNPLKFYSIGNYKNDLPVGNWNFYYLNGRLLNSKTYNENGEITGASITYNENGEKVIEDTYENGELKKTISWDRVSKKTTIMLFEDNKLVKTKNYNKLVKN